MDPNELLRIVDAIHRDKNIDKEIVFEGIEAALVSAAKKHYGEEAEVVVRDRPHQRLDPRHLQRRGRWTRPRWPSGSARRPPSR